MPINPADVSVAINGDIRWTGVGAGSGPYTVLELHRFLQDLADNASSSGNDLLDITSPTPSERSTDNIITLLGNYNIDAEMAQHLYDGSITQKGGDEIYSGLVVVGSVASTTTLMIIQNNELYDDGVHNPENPFWGTGLNADPSANILMRCLIRTRTNGNDIDGKRIRIQARELGDTYAEFSATLGLGNTVAAIFTNTDLNNQTSASTIASWNSITNQTQGYNLIDLDNGAGPRAYYSKWTRSNYTINQLYERAKWLQRRGSTTTLYGLPGQLFRGITHEINLNTSGSNSGNFNAYEKVIWNGGTGQMLAIDNQQASSATKMWIQLLTGNPPGANTTITGQTSNATATTTASNPYIARSISPCFIGQSTGSAIIGAYGIGIAALDLTYNDKVFDLTNTQQIPPNNVTFSVTGVVSGGDYVLVGPASGGNFDFSQLTLQNTLNSSGQTSVVVTTNIPADTPSAGYIRVQLNDGRYRKVQYTSWSGQTFTTPSTDWSSPNNANSGNNVMITYIDKLADDSYVSFVTKYSSDRNLFIRVRNGGPNPIKTFETIGVLGVGGGSVSAIRTSDM